MAFILRLATQQDAPALWDLIQHSARRLQSGDYCEAQIEAALGGVFGVDSQLIADGTYFAVAPAGDSGRIVGCGGWSRRRTLFGGDAWSGREDKPLDPACDAAKIRAFFVHPDWSRQGIAKLILSACERAAREAGFTRLELGATLTGVPLYAACGYVEMGRSDVPLTAGLTLPIVHMAKALA